VTPPALPRISWPSSVEGWARFGVASGEVYGIHLDRQHAVEAGLPTQIGLGSLLWAYAHEALRIWLPQHRVSEIEGRFTEPWLLGDTVSLSGMVQSDKAGILVVDYEATVDRGATVMTGTAQLVALAADGGLRESRIR
jgi:acyl dehydratase